MKRDRMGNNQTNSKGYYYEKNSRTVLSSSENNSIKQKFGENEARSGV
jgi:hypothetical protein